MMDRNRPIPFLYWLTYVLAVLSGLTAGASLLIDVATGVSGFYVDGWVTAFFASTGAMIVFFAASIAIGIRALRDRGRSAGWMRGYVLALALELIEAGGGITVSEFVKGVGVGVLLLIDALVLCFLGTLIAFSNRTRRELVAPGSG